jgi:hypothetical protein
MAGRSWTPIRYVLPALVLVCAVGAFVYWYTKKNDESGRPLGLGQANGLNGQERDTWYHLSQGTEFFPLHFLRALDDADTGKPFMEDLERFGFIPDAKGPQNPYGLPVGMTADTTRDLRFSDVVMVGINCAACHTSALEFGGGPILRADGGTNQFDGDVFRDSLMKNARQTIQDPAKLVAFVGRLVRQSVAEGFDMAGAKGGLLTDKLAKKLGDKIEKAFDTDGGAEPMFAKKLQDSISQELKEEPLDLDLTRGLVTRLNDPNRKEATAKIQDKIKSALAKGQALFKPETLLEPGPLAEEVITSLRLLRARLKALEAIDNSPKTDPGFGRVDAFGGARNTLFPNNREPLDAPVRYPFIWTIKDQLKWYHWDGNTQSIRERNTGEALGVGAILNLETFDSTIRFDNLDTLENLAKKLTPPIWPKEFGDIDHDKAKAGAKHFEQFCAKCHAGPNANGSTIIPLNVIKTDDRRIKNVRKSVGDVGFFDAQSPILKKTIRQAGVQLEGDKNVWRPSQDLDPDLAEGYPNRPLPAVWASPPYLHNGSVPNIYQLLLPEDERVKTFPVGHREYDPKHLGYTLQPASNLFLYDTSKTGNFNGGHSGPEYGTDQLNDDKRWELIEYLKTR